MPSQVLKNKYSRCFWGIYTLILKWTWSSLKSSPFRVATEEGRKLFSLVYSFVLSFYLFTHFYNDPSEQNRQTSALVKLTYCFYVFDQTQTLLISSAEPSLLFSCLWACLNRLLLYYCSNFPQISPPWISPLSNPFPTEAAVSVLKCKAFHVNSILKISTGSPLPTG